LIGNAEDRLQERGKRLSLPAFSSKPLTKIITTDASFKQSSVLIPNQNSLVSNISAKSISTSLTSLRLKIASATPTHPEPAHRELICFSFSECRYGFAND
jgi:hypothetical protein